MSGPTDRRSPGSLQTPMWRAVAVFRLAALAYAAVLIVSSRGDYAHPHAAWPVLAVMAGWTAVTWWAYAHRAWRRWPLLLADLLVTVGVVLSAPLVIGRASLATGTPTLAVAWLAAPVLAWAVSGGRRRGLIAALIIGAAEVSVRGSFQHSTLTGAMLMILAAVAVGHVARLGVVAEERLQRAVELEAANRERERLARGIHDSVLQVLAMVQRRGAKLDGEAGELARLAGEQEAALRALIATGPVAAGDGVVDLRTVLNVYAGPAVSIAVPAVPVPLPARVAREVGAAVGAALANVERHCGPAARAWVLVEDEAGLGADDPAEAGLGGGAGLGADDPAGLVAGDAAGLVADDAAGLAAGDAAGLVAGDEAGLVAGDAAGHRGGVVTVTVRDDGPGIPGGRLGEAAAEGRLGVAQSIRGRIADLGGTARITSAPGEGTEIELRIPRGLR